MAKKGSTFRKYSYEEKLEIVEDYLGEGSGGFREIARKYQLKSDKQVRDWVEKYKVDPQLLAVDGRGRKSSVQSQVLDTMSLEEQNQYLRMENAILKKQKALRNKSGAL